MGFAAGQVKEAKKKGKKMSIFNDDRETFNQAADSLDNGLSKCGLDAVLQRAFDNGLDLDEIMYVVQTHTEKTVRSYIVQARLKKAANKDRV